MREHNNIEVLERQLITSLELYIGWYADVGSGNINSLESRRLCLAYDLLAAMKERYDVFDEVIDDDDDLPF